MDLVVASIRAGRSLARVACRASVPVPSAVSCLRYPSFAWAHRRIRPTVVCRLCWHVYEPPPGHESNHRSLCSPANRQRYRRSWTGRTLCWVDRVTLPSSLSSRTDVARRCDVCCDRCLFDPGTVELPPDPD